jgi:hypothetical protein
MAPRAQFASFARVVNLRPADLPGFVAEHESSHGHAGRAVSGFAHELKRCVGNITESKPVAKRGSPRLASGDQLHKISASSEVEVAPSIATALHERAELKRIFAGSATRACFTRFFEQAFLTGVKRGLARASRRQVKTSVSVGKVRLVPFNVGSMARGTSGGVGASLNMPVTIVGSARGRTVRVPTDISLDVISVLVGRASVSVNTLNFGATFPAQQEAHLFSLMTSRAVAASHTYPAVLK